MRRQTVQAYLFTTLLGLALAWPAFCNAQEGKTAEKSAEAGEAAEVVAQTRPSTESLLPASTRFWVSAGDLERLDANLAKTQLGTLASRDSLKPFFASFEGQVRDALDRNGVKFGIDLESVRKLKTGEVAIAGVLPAFPLGARPTAGSHGVVVLFDVSKGAAEADAFIEEATKRMLERNAKQEKLEINGTSVSKWTVEVANPRVNHTQNSWVTLIDGWILASDNEAIFRGVLQRIKSKKEATADDLGGSVVFKSIQAQTAVKGVTPDIRWHVDPIGYARLADALAEEKKGVKVLKDRPLEVLSKEGLDAIKAVGGFVSFATAEHDMLHRTLVYTEKGKALDAAKKRLLSMLDFSPKGHNVETMPGWVPVDAGSYFAITWDVQRAWAGVGHFVDAFQEPGVWQGILDNMKENPKFRVDLNRIVASFGKRATVITETTEPISESSEKMLIGVELAEGVDGKWLLDSMRRAVGGKMKKLAGFDYVIDVRDDSEAELDPGIKIEIDEEFEDDLEDDLDDDDEFEDDELDDDDGDAEPEKLKVTLFNRRFYAIRGNTFFICNDKDYLKEILVAKSTKKFAESADVTQMKTALMKLTDTSKVRFRMYTRLDKILKTNYEMMRLGKMAESETFMARLLNQVYGKKAKPEDKREQQIDASKLPSDFEKEIAPFLGLSGWAMEGTDSGWKFSGCVLKRETPVEDDSTAPVATDSPVPSDSGK